MTCPVCGAALELQVRGPVGTVRCPHYEDPRWHPAYLPPKYPRTFRAGMYEAPLHCSRLRNALPRGLGLSEGE